MTLQKKIINFLYNLSRSYAFKKLLNRYSFEDPVHIIEAYNRHNGFEVSASDFSLRDEVFNSEEDIELLNRICDAFILSKKHQPDTGIYAVDGMWRDIIDFHYRKLTDAAINKDFDVLQKYLHNMFRSGTHGLSMSGAIPNLNDAKSVESYINNYIDSMLKLALYLNIPSVRKDMENEYFIFAEKIRPSQLFGQLCEMIDIKPIFPMIGNPFGLRINDGMGQQVIPRVAYRLLYTSIKVKEITDSYDSPIILEIGGGFGGLIYYISQIIKKPLVLTNIDIPETNIISSYFLSKAIPSTHIVFYGESSESGQGDRIKVSILPNWEIAKLPSNSVDVVVNTDSLPEMPEETVIEYLRRIADMSFYFYSLNQDCGRHGQTRLSQIAVDRLGLKCISHSVAWMRRGYFERIYSSTKNIQYSQEILSSPDFQYQTRPTSERLRDSC
jgi:hypothetical protein